MPVEKDLIVEMFCPLCGKKHFVHTREKDFLIWRKGVSIQKAMPYLSAEEREQLISEICPNCQKKIFGSDEEEEEEDVNGCMWKSLEFTGQWW